MQEHVELLRQQGLPVPHKNKPPQIIIQNDACNGERLPSGTNPTVIQMVPRAC